jgi:nitrogenase molybdenum-iron protein alpha chain
MSLDYENDGAAAERMIEEVLSAYPEKFAKRRKKHLSVAKPSTETGEQGEALTECDVKSNIKSVPGVMTIRGCAYAGSKGVVWGPIKDMVHISHGPVGCGQYSWSQRRNYYIGKTGIDSFVTMQFTSDFQERDIVFGGDKKLDKVIDEINTLFPLANGVSIQSECPIGLIGDDIEAVSRKKAKEIGKTVVPVRCEGFRGVSQSLGHHIANDAVRDWVFDNKGGAPRNAAVEAYKPGPYDVNVIGDYNIGGDAWSSRILLEEIGLNVVGNWSGDATLAEIERAPKAKLNLIHCYRSMNYICRHMEEKYGVAWMEYNFFGPSQIEASLRKIAAHFGPEIEAKAEAVIAKYAPLVEAIKARYRPRLEGKTVMLYVGGLRPRHVITAYEDLGMEIVGTGYEFGHNDDYQRTGHYVKNGTLIYDDVTGYELEKFIETLRPDLVGSGIKEKYPTQKLGVPFRQMHSWDYSGPYHGYDGFAIFARDMDLAINNPVWGLFDAPWAPKAAAPNPYAVAAE